MRTPPQLIAAGTPRGSRRHVLWEPHGAFEVPGVAGGLRMGGLEEGQPAPKDGPGAFNRRLRPAASVR
jgi:hypothetical protein